MAFDEDLANRIRELVGSERGLTEKRMFGGLAFLINGKMAVAASGQGGLLVRVDPTKAHSLLHRQHARPFEMRDARWRDGCASTPTASARNGSSSHGSRAP